MEKITDLSMFVFMLCASVSLLVLSFAALQDIDVRNKISLNNDAHQVVRFKTDKD